MQEVEQCREQLPRARRKRFFTVFSVLKSDQEALTFCIAKLEPALSRPQLRKAGAVFKT
jgi:hypothetical protein